MFEKLSGIINLDLLVNAITGILLPAVVACVTVLITRKNEQSKNIVSTTTSTRIKRFESLRDFGVELIANTAPELLLFSEKNVQEIVQKVYKASSGIGLYLHRNFDNDLKLINLSEEIAQLAIKIIKQNSLSNDSDELTKLINLREDFKSEIDIYLNTEWYRIKKETLGKETRSSDWHEINSSLKLSYPNNNSTSNKKKSE